MLPDWLWPGPPMIKSEMISWWEVRKKKKKDNNARLESSRAFTFYGGPFTPYVTGNLGSCMFNELYPNKFKVVL